MSEASSFIIIAGQRGTNGISLLRQWVFSKMFDTGIDTLTLMVSECSFLAPVS